MEIWTTKFELGAYSINPLIIHTPGNDGGKGSNLSETYPYILNYILRQIPVSDTITLDWGLSENFAKLGPFNLNGIQAIVMAIVLLGPSWLYPILLGWLGLEFVASLDFKNSIKFLAWMGLAYGLRFGTLQYIYPFVSKSVKQVL